jgi:hypothetical protein
MNLASTIEAQTTHALARTATLVINHLTDFQRMDLQPLGVALTVTHTPGDQCAGSKRIEHGRSRLCAVHPRLLDIEARNVILLASGSRAPKAP